MTRPFLINAALFLMAFVVVYIFVIFFVNDALSQSGSEYNDKENDKEIGFVVQDSELGPCVRDAGGFLVQIKPYQRIVCLSASIDGFLLATMQRKRIHALSAGSKGKPYTLTKTFPKLIL